MYMAYSLHTYSNVDRSVTDMMMGLAIHPHQLPTAICTHLHGLSMAYVLPSSDHYCHIVTYIVTYTYNVLYSPVLNDSHALVDRIDISIC